MGNSDSGVLQVKWAQSHEMTFFNWVAIARSQLLILWVVCSKAVAGGLGCILLDLSSGGENVGDWDADGEAVDVETCEHSKKRTS